MADCGLPIPLGTPTVDLALVFGVPRFTEVLDALMDDVVFEGCLAASEAIGETAGEWIAERFPGADYVSHDELKTMVASAKIVVRSGEATPYANVILRCGVPF